MGDRRLRDRRGGRRLRPVRVLAPERVYRRRGAAVVGRAHRRHPRRPRGADLHVGRRRAVPRPRRVVAGVARRREPRRPRARRPRVRHPSRSARDCLCRGARRWADARPEAAARAADCQHHAWSSAAGRPPRRSLAAAAERVAAATHDRALLDPPEPAAGALCGGCAAHRVAASALFDRCRHRDVRRRQRAALGGAAVAVGAAAAGVVAAREDELAGLAGKGVARAAAVVVRAHVADRGGPRRSRAGAALLRAAVAAALAAAVGAHDDARVNKAREVAARAGGAAGALLLGHQPLAPRADAQDADRALPPLAPRRRPVVQELLALIQGLAHARRRPLLSRRARLHARAVRSDPPQLPRARGRRAVHAVLGRCRRDNHDQHCRRPPQAAFAAR